MAQGIDQTDRQILNVIQSAFPLTEEPFQAIGDQLSLPPDEVIDRIRAMKKIHVVRQISAIFDTRRLGYKTSLVAMRFPQENLHKAALHINRHPGVSHNYERTGSFNLWFTIAVPPHHDLQAVVERMGQEEGAEAVRIMPTIRFFKIGVNFDMLTRKGASYDYFSPDGYGKDDSRALNDWNKVEPVTPFEIEVIRQLQEDLALAPRPFDDMSRLLGITNQQLFAHADDFRERGVMRRFSAVLHHRRAGFRANAMGVWKVEEERAEEVGLKMAQHPAVSHCYQRPTFPDWPYTHFSMIHAVNQAECEQVASEISEQIGVTEFQLLYSTREYKKTRVRYFVEDEFESESQPMAASAASR